MILHWIEPSIDLDDVDSELVPYSDPESMYDTTIEGMMARFKIYPY